MTRDPNLLRTILLGLEQQAPISTSAIHIEGATPTDVQYHCNLLLRADYIDAKNLSNIGRFELLIVGLTWKGHEFAESVHDQATWLAIRAELKLDQQPVPFSVIEEYARQRARLAAGLPERVPDALEAAYLKTEEPTAQSKS